MFVSNTSISDNSLPSERPIELQWTKLPIVSNTECKSTWAKEGRDFNEREIVCVGFLKSNSTGICQGDSGGPLICHQNGQTVLTGIVSWGRRDCKTHMPNMFTRVVNYIEWIEIYMEKTSSQYKRNKRNPAYDYSQEHGDLQTYKDSLEQRDSQENGSSKEEPKTYGLKQGIEQNPGSCPKLPNYMRGGAQGRIIHGHKANNPIPWQVSIQPPWGSQKCGGTILDRTTILSAAHCFRDKKTDYTDYMVLAGKVSRNAYNENSYIRIAKVILHPEWNFTKIINDVAIVKLSRPVPFDKNIKSMCLPSKDFKPREGEMCIASGWGRTEGEK